MITVLKTPSITHYVHKKPSNESSLHPLNTVFYTQSNWDAAAWFGWLIYIRYMCVCVCVRPSPVNQSDFIFSSRPLRHWLFGAPSFFHLFCRFMMKLDVQPSCWSLHVYYCSITRSSTYCKMASVCCCVILSTHLFDDYSCRKWSDPTYLFINSTFQSCFFSTRFQTGLFSCSRKVLGKLKNQIELEQKLLQGFLSKICSEFPLIWQRHDGNISVSLLETLERCVLKCFVYLSTFSPTLVHMEIDLWVTYFRSFCCCVCHSFPLTPTLSLSSSC